MLNIVTRKDGARLRTYFGEDFASPMWKDVGGELEIVRPRKAVVCKRGLGDWGPLAKDDFDATVAGAERGRRGGVVSFECTFSPPKSFSVAALAGPQVMEGLVADHACAVDDALRFMGSYLFTRREQKGVLELVPVAAQALSFSHAWNLIGEPQLHTHVNLFRMEGDGALHGYPLFLHQRAARAVYHFSLVSRLVRSGVLVRISKAGNLAWELVDIDVAALRAFAERSAGLKATVEASPGGYFSQGTEMRLAALHSRRELPRTDPMTALDDARVRWEQVFSPDQCRVFPGGLPIAGNKFIEPPVEEQFRRSAVMTKAMFEASLLERWLGSSLPVESALRATRRILRRWMREKSVVGEQRGLAFCAPAVFAQETEVLKILDCGRSQGRALSWEWPPGKSVWPRALLDEVARRPDRARLACTFGRGIPQGAELVDGDGLEVDGAVTVMPVWSAEQALKYLRERADDAFLVVQEGYRHGDFLERLARLNGLRALRFARERKTFKIRGRTISIVEASRAWTHMGGDGSVPIVFMPSVSGEEVSRRNQQALEFLQGQRRRQWSDVAIFEKNTLPQFLNADGLEGCGFFARRNCDGFRHGSTWWIESAQPEIKSLVLRGVRRTKTVTVEELLKAGDALVAFVRGNLKVAAGLPVRSLVQYREGRNHFREDEIVVVREIGPDGRMWFEDGRSVSAAYRLLAPAMAIGKLIPEQPLLGRVVIEGDAFLEDPGKIAQLPFREIVIASGNPAVARRRMADFFEDQLRRRHDRTISRVLNTDEESGDGTDSGGGGLLLSRAQWRRILDEEPKARPGPVVAPETTRWMWLFEQQRQRIAAMRSPKRYGSKLKKMHLPELKDAGGMQGP